MKPKRRGKWSSPFWLHLCSSVFICGYSFAGLGAVEAGVVADLLVQRVAVDAELLRRRHLHLVALAQHLLDQLALDRLDDALVQAAVRQRVDAEADELADQALEV